MRKVCLDNVIRLQKGFLDKRLVHKVLSQYRFLSVVAFLKR